MSDLLADAELIREYMGAELAPVESAIVTIQRFRDMLPGGASLGMPSNTANVDELLGDLIRDLRSPVVDVEIQP